MAKQQDDFSTGNEGSKESTRYDPDVLLARYGDAKSALRRLAEKAEKMEGENYHYREQIRDLKAKQLSEGSVAVTKEQAEMLDAYQALGTPDELQKRVAAAQEATQKVERYERERELRKIAGAASATFEVLRDIGADLTYEVRKEKVEGQEDPVEVVYVKNGDTPTRFDEYAKQEWSHYLPALFPDSETQQDRPGSREVLGQPPSRRAGEKEPTFEERKAQFAHRVQL